MATLRLVPASGSDIEIDGDQAVVGRDPSCDVVVNDTSVSRKHARLERWGGNWAVVDQRSANGTFLDGKRVAETMLRAGQELRFGAVAYRVEIDEDETGATVLMSMPAVSQATVMQPAVIPPRPAVPRPPTPPATPPPAARPAMPPPGIPPVPHMAHPPEPVEKGKGPLFWSALAGGGLLLLALIGFGAIVGVSFYGSRGAVSGVEVDGDEGGAGGASAADGAGLTIETIAVNKVPQGQIVTVKIDVRVTGFDLRPEGNLFRVDLAEDLETFGPDGKRIEELSRVGLETFNHTTTSATDATATFNTSLTFSKPDPGKYRAILTIRDMVGMKREKHEVPFDLP